MSVHTPTDAAAEYSTNLESPQSQPATKGDIQHLESQIEMLISLISQNTRAKPVDAPTSPDELRHKVLSSRRKGRTSQAEK